MNFETIKNFIVDNWQFISIVLIIICNILLWLIRRKEKKTSFDVALENFLLDVPLYVIEAEKKFGAGEGKKKHEYVVKQCRSYLVNQLGRTLTKTEQNTIDRDVYFQIDSVLCSPTKKGGLGRE